MNKLKRNIFYSTFYQIIQIILPLITTPYISRVLGAAGVGTISYAQTIVSYFVLFALLGLENYGSREIAQCKNHKELNNTFNEIVFSQFFMVIATIIIYFIYIAFFASNKQLYLLYTLMLFGQGISINWFFWGMENFKITVIRNLILKIISILCLFLFVKTKQDIMIYALINILSVLLGELWLWKITKNTIDIRMPAWVNIKKHIQPNLMLFLPVLSKNIYLSIDKLMLGAMSTIESVGIYTYAETIVKLPMGIVTAFSTAMMPRITNLYSNHDTVTTKKYLRLSMFAILFITSAISFGIAAIAPTLIPLFLGNDFNDAITIVEMLSIIVIIISIGSIFRTQILIPLKKDKEYSRSIIIGAVINVIINLLLIPKIGILGAAIGTVLSEFTVVCIQLYYIKNEVHIINSLLSGIPFILFGLIMFILIRTYFQSSLPTISNLLIQIMAGGSFYLVCSSIYFIIYKKRLYHN
ncbi:MAG: oligosaccharide flippase family protein [Beduini sp.]|uniref:oligosaccharide flippase family protein n=1 Tax=Beduini sp. TaxID=1922300 RepID=UPI0039A18DBB